MYILRLDDAAEYMNVPKWDQMETLLDKYDIKPIVGIIPLVKDPELLSYQYCPDIWERAKTWQSKGWTLAMHGCTHEYHTNEGGINPVNCRSEFAGMSLNQQREKIRKGYNYLLSLRIKPDVFFAPSHTFDLNTLRALKEESDIRIISDTVANDVYYENEFYFIPQQSGKVRNLPFKTTTFCYHPNKMTDEDFEFLSDFFKKNQRKFISFDFSCLHKRNRGFLDKVLRWFYFFKRMI